MHYKLASLASLIQTTSAASANVVDIDVRSNHDYFGPLFVGSGFSESRVIYDTMSDWSVVLTEDSNSAVMSNYNYKDSTSAKAVRNITNEEQGPMNYG